MALSSFVSVFIPSTPFNSNSPKISNKICFGMRFKNTALCIKASATNWEPSKVHPQGDKVLIHLDDPSEVLEQEINETKEDVLRVANEDVQVAKDDLAVAKEDVRATEDDLAAAKEDVRAKEDDLAAAKRSGNKARITAAMDLAAASKKHLTAARYRAAASKKHLTAARDRAAACKKHLTALTEKQLLVRKQKPISKSFRKADYDWIASVTGINSSEYQNWVERSEESPNGYVLDEAVKPGDGFKAAFEQVSKVVHMKNEAGRRIFLNLFLGDVVVRFDGVLRIFREVDMVVESGGAERRRLGGKIDYAVGFGKGMDIFEKTPRQKLHLVALEAKTSFGEDDFRHCVAETATLYKSLVDAEKTTKTVWGILSNAIDWEFIHIDDSGSLWRSNKFHINLKCYEEAKIHYSKP